MKIHVSTKIFVRLRFLHDNDDEDTVISIKNKSTACSMNARLFSQLVSMRSIHMLISLIVSEISATLKFLHTADYNPVITISSIVFSKSNN